MNYLLPRPDLTVNSFEHKIQALSEKELGTVKKAKHNLVFIKAPVSGLVVIKLDHAVLRPLGRGVLAWHLQGGFLFDHLWNS